MNKYIDIAVIVEPRCHKYLIPIIKTVYKKCNVPILIFHGNNNRNFIINNLKEVEYNLINLNKDDLTIREYSDLLLTNKFWENINGENILIFQTDSCVSNYNEELLKECSQYGFIGAPTRKIKPIPWQNGGLSLRKKSLMIKAIKTIPHNKKIFPEDRFFSQDCAKICNPAPWNIANKFSVEIHYYDKPFGFHKCWNYQNKENIEKLKITCPELHTIFNL
jgi:hypothetical protein